MYGKIPERKLKEADYLFSCEEARKELDQYMDTENRRVNVDSAKKLAVLQHMDYEGFRQMVLGANIFPTKSKDLNNFSMGTQEKIQVQNKMFVAHKGYEFDKKIQGNSEKHCFNFRDFKKKFSKNYEKQLTWERAEECYALLKQQNRERLQKIFNVECEADILLKVVDIFRFVKEYLVKEEKIQECKVECGFMVSWLQIVLAIPTMQDVSLNILTKKQRERVCLFLEECKSILDSQEEQASISKVVALIIK